MKPTGVTRPTTLVFLNNFPHSYLGGGEVHLMQLLRGAIRAEMKVVVVAMPNSGLARKAESAGAIVVPLDLMQMPPVLVLAKVAKIVSQHGAAVVHGTGYYTNLLARLTPRTRRTAVVNSIHCEPGSGLAFQTGGMAHVKNCLRSAADRATFCLVDALVADARAIARPLIAQGFSERKVRVIHNAIDPSSVRGDASQFGTDAPEESVSGRRPLVIGSVGRLEPVKGLDILLEAFARLLAVREDVELRIAGVGPEQSHLQMAIQADPRLASHVTLAGYVPSAPAFMANLDVYCMPSLSEGFSTSLLEALALGLPVVASRVGGTDEVVGDGVTGRLVPPGDPVRLAVVLEEVLADPRGRARMGEAGRALVEREFTVEKMVSRTLALYRDLCTAKASSRSHFDSIRS